MSLAQRVVEIWGSFFLPAKIATPPIHFPDSLSFPIRLALSPAAGLAALPFGGAQKHSLPYGGAQKHLRQTYVAKE